IIYINPKSTITFWNKAAEKIFGYLENEVLGNDVTILMPERYKTLHKKGMKRYLTTGKTKYIGKPIELEGLRKNGEEFSLELSVSTWKIAGTKNFTAILRDISERKERDILASTLNNINIDISTTLDFDEIIQKVLVKGATALRSESAAVYIREDNTWTVEYGYNLPEGLLNKRFFGKDVQASLHASKLKKAFLVKEALTDNKFSLNIAKKFNILSYVVVPIIVKNDVIGTILFHRHKKPTTFTQAQMDFSNSLSTSVSLAIGNARLFQAEHEIAETLQKSLLSGTVPKIKGLEIDFFYRSATEQAEVGGDFYDFFKVSESMFAIVMGDTAGKGIEAATEISKVKFLLREQAKKSQNPSVILKKVNDALLEPFTELFYTITFTIYDVNSSVLSITNAGNPYPYLTREDDFIKQTWTPLAIFPVKQYPLKKIKLKKDDMFIMFTDGLIEPRNNGDMFGEERVRKLVKENKNLRIKELLKKIVSEAREFSNYRLTDDILVIGIRKL
ncbi:MAG: PAS domain S-box protein, partial [Actinobacteria bacterium]